MDTARIWLPLTLSFMAGIFTVVGSFITFFIRDFKKSYLQFFLGLSSGVMIYVSFVELLPSSITAIGPLKANVAFFGGIFLVMLIDFFVPHEYIAERIKVDTHDKKLMAAGIFTAIGIGIHNFPEGLAVFMSALVNIKLGIALAIAIALHNIPEGIAVAMPIFYATKSKKKAFWYSFLSGFAEPAGAVIAILVLMPFLNPAVLSFILALVAGIMVFISFDELLPLSCQSEGYHISIFGVIIGMAVMALSLILMQQ
ncbi:MAG: zinc transporter ZupT [Candidatus Omnitrophica bacterium]|nr:zinc transporter ZupT [Candidatus Omnitrophota bacterium]MDD5236391.1 zinc transporter ZupT [Candidatus Omnitrophota bacterium]MDD5610683.1 zinc transporter ZupT [Candidatus Omnitrophota bacterium]